MIVVSRRHALQQSLEQMLSTRWGVGRTRPTLFLDGLRELLNYLTTFTSHLERYQFLVVDLESCLHEGNVAQQLLDAWRAFPPLHVVMVCTQRQVRDQIMIVDAVKTELPFSTTLFGTDAYDPLIWDDLYRKRVSNTWGPGLQNDLTRVAFSRNQLYRAQERIFEILRIAPRVGQVQDVCSLLKCGRHNLWRELHNAEQLNPSDLLTVFRLLYAAKLRSVQWSGEVVARYLGFPSAKECARRFKQRLGVNPKVFYESHESTLRWVVDALATQAMVGYHVQGGAQNLKRHAQAFLKQTTVRKVIAVPVAVNQ